MHAGASELSEGLTVAEILERRRLTEEEVVTLLRDTAEVLALVHEAGVIHGGLAPHTLVLACGPRAFPVQIGGWTDVRAQMRPLDDREDIRALGAIAYRAITGRDPGPHAPEMIAGVAGLLSALIVHMLADDPERRPTADEVVAATHALAGQRGDRSRVPRGARMRWTPPPMPAVEVAEIVELVDRRARARR